MENSRTDGTISQGLEAMLFNNSPTQALYNAEVSYYPEQHIYTKCVFSCLKQKNYLKCKYIRKLNDGI